MCDHENREAAMVVVAPNVWCDPCLVPLVTALNAGGLDTVASCCGHGRRPASVWLADDTVITVMGRSDFDRIAPLWPDINADPTAPPVPPKET